MARECSIGVETLRNGVKAYEAAHPTEDDPLTISERLERVGCTAVQVVVSRLRSARTCSTDCPELCLVRGSRCDDV